MFGQLGCMIVPSAPPSKGGAIIYLIRGESLRREKDQDDRLLLQKNVQSGRFCGISLFVPKAYR